MERGRKAMVERNGATESTLRAARHGRAVVAVTTLLWLLAGAPLAAAVVIDFEGLISEEVVDTQYASLGLTFSNATVLTAGISLDEFENPPRSGANVVFDDGGPLMIGFATPVASVFGYFTYALQSPMRLLFTAFDGLGGPVGSASSLFSNNQLISGEPGSVPNEFLGVAFASGIAAVTITGDVTGGSFTLDDLTFARVPTQSVPEPTSLALLALGLVALRRRCRRLALLPQRGALRWGRGWTTFARAGRGSSRRAIAG